MYLISIIEIFIFFVGIYYLYYLLMNYSVLKREKKFYDEYRNQFLYSLFGAISIIVSFQVFWFSNFYIQHTYIEIIVKIIITIFSFINQMLISEIEKQKRKLLRKKNDDINLYLKYSEKNTGFKLINRLILINIVFKAFYQKP